MGCGAAPAFDEPLAGYRVYDARGDQARGGLPPAVDDFHARAPVDELERETRARYALPDHDKAGFAHQKSFPCAPPDCNPRASHAFSVMTLPWGVRRIKPS